MPYSMDSPPAIMKGMPKGLMSIFIGAFNASIDSAGGDEAKAFRIAWAAVGKKYKKDKDGNWVKLESIKLDDWDEEMAIESIAEVIDLKTYSKEVFELRVCEVADISFEGVAKEENGRRFVWLKMMRPGWSYNGNYWTPKAAESMAEHIMREGSRKLFIDHRFDADAKKYGRSMKEWVATAIESRIVKGIPLVKTEVFASNASANDIWEKIQKYPDQVGTSVDARVKIRNGEAEGKKGHIVEEVVRLNSLDFVNEPSAGGGVIGIAASKMDDDMKQAFKDHITEQLMLLEQVAMDLGTAMKSRDQQRKFWDLQSMLSTVMRNIACADEANMPIEDKKKAIETSLQQFHDEVSKLDLVAFESKDKTKIKANKPEEDETMPYANLEELKKAQPELEKALRESIIIDLKSGQEAQEGAKKLKEVTEQNTTLTTENKKLSDEIKTFKDKEILATKHETRDKMIADAKIPDEYVSESFRSSVRNTPEDKDALELIKDRQEIVTKAESKKSDSGKPDFKTRKPESVQANTKEKKKSDFDATKYRETVGLTETKIEKVAG